MKRALTIAVLAVAVSGCQWGLKPEREAAYQRWHGARATVLQGVATEQLKVGDLDKAQNYAVQALSLDKDNLSARLVLGKVLLEKGQYREALAEFRQVEAKAPDSAEVAYLMGVALEKQESPEEALKCYQRARALDPENDAYVTASAETLVRMNRAREALSLLETRLEKVTAGPSALSLAGEVALVAGEPSKAADYFQRCLDLEPTSLEVRENLARALYFAGRYSQAVPILEDLTTRKQHRDKSVWVYLMLGDSLLAGSRPRQAEVAYEAASRMEPEDPLIWMALAKSELCAGDPGRAVLSVRQAMAVGAEGPEPALVLGYSLLRDARAEEAAAVLNSAVDKHASEPALWCALGRCHAALGRQDRAVWCYTEALRADPRDRLAQCLLSATAAEGPGH